MAVTRQSLRQPTLADVARDAGVSVMTVSNVVNSRKTGIRDDTRGRVLESIKRLRYRPQLHARGLRLAKSWCVGVLIVAHEADSLGTPWTSRMVQGVSSVLSAHGFGLLLDIRTPSAVADSVLLKLANTDGIIAILAGSDEERGTSWDLLMALQVPLVAVQEILPTERGRDMAVVRQSEYESAFELASHVLMAGAKQLRFIAPDYKRPNMAQRYNGITEAALKVSGATTAVVSCKDETFASVHSALTADLARNGLPCAYLAANELIALGALDVLEAAGHALPADVMLTSFNAFELWFYAKKKITTISFPALELGAKAAHLMLARISGKGFPRKVTVLPGVFVQGQTTRPQETQGS